MAKFTKYFIGVVLSALFTWQPLCYAGAVKEKVAGVTETGVTSNTSNTSHGEKKAKEAVIFSAYDFGATAVYNNAGGAAATSGWIDVADFSDDIIFHVNLTTLGSTNLTITWQGLLSDDTTAPMDIYDEVFTAVDTGYVTHLSEGALKYVRIKGITTGDSTDACTIFMRAEGAR